MPPINKHNVAVVLFDINASPTFIEEAKKCLLNICMWKMIVEPNDCMKLIFLNTEETNNILALKYNKCPHICEATDFIVYDPKLIKPHLDGLEDVKKEEANWLMGLTVAIEQLTEKENTKGVVTLQLLFFSDFSKPTDIKEKQIEFVIRNINRLGAYLYILGPKVEIPQHMKSDDDVQNWSRNLECIMTKESNFNLEVAQRIVRACKRAVMCDLKVGTDLFKCYTKRSGLQPWKVPLTIGTSLSFNTSTSRFLNENHLIKFDAKKERSNNWKWCLASDVAIEVPFKNVIGGVVMYGKFIPFPEDIERNLNYNGPRSFKIVGFTNLCNIKEHYIGEEGAACVEVDDDDKMFHLLLNVLTYQNKCAIVERVYMQNCSPKLMALVPQFMDSNFVLLEIPYKHDIIRTPVEEQSLDEAPPLKKIDSKSSLRKGLYEYLQNLDINDPFNRDTNNSVKFPLSPSLKDDLAGSSLMDQCLKKYFGGKLTKEDKVKLELPEFLDSQPYAQLFLPRPVKEEKK